MRRLPVERPTTVLQALMAMRRWTRERTLEELELTDEVRDINSHLLGGHGVDRR